MGLNKLVIGISAGILFLIVLIYFGAEEELQELKNLTSEVAIEDTWELPKELAEISGMAFLGEDRIVGVQDENGILYVYDLQTKKIEKEINFGRNGDYEAVAISGAVAFVLVSDGTLIKIDDYMTDPKVSKIDTGLTQKQDSEGLCMDEKHNRLLIAIKEEDPKEKQLKGIFAVSLTDFKMEATPVFKLDFQDAVFEEVRKKDLQDTFKPSEINIHPVTGEIYLLEGQEAKLLILDKEGNPKQLFVLDQEDFPQPEGLTFDRSGNLYISNEGSPSTIHRVTLK